MKKATRRKLIKGGIWASVALVLLDALWHEKNNIEWNYFDISKTSKNRIKIIQISDLHLNEIRSFHKYIAQKINALQPDLVFITGDSVNNTENIAALNTFLELIDNSIKKYAILGNWEYWGKVDLQKLQQVYAKNNCDLLINENRTVSIRDRELSIIGIDDFVGGNADFKKASKNVKKTDTTIVLSHCPKHRDFIISEKNDLNIDLILSGHTHGGQVSFLGVAPLTPKGSGKYLKGWYTETEPKMYVSRGIGTSMLPIRFCARAEMVEIDV